MLNSTATSASPFLLFQHPGQIITSTTLQYPNPCKVVGRKKKSKQKYQSAAAAARTCLTVHSSTQRWHRTDCSGSDVYFKGVGEMLMANSSGMRWAKLFFAAPPNSFPVIALTFPAFSSLCKNWDIRQKGRKDHPIESLQSQTAGIARAEIRFPFDASISTR